MGIKPKDLTPVMSHEALNQIHDSMILMSKNPPNATGRKDDAGKLPLDLLDPLALDGLAAVLAFGAKKYDRHNWRGGISWSRLMAALLRHSFAILRGEFVDPESGLPHIDHIGCCWMFLSWMTKKRPDLNDLWSPDDTVGKV